MTRRAGFQAGPEYFQWRPPNQSLVIHLSLTVIDRLEADVMRGFFAVPKRGAEVGGLLIGRTSADGSAIFVDGYEPVECEHRRGPSYMLSEPDRRRLERTLRRLGTARQVVGFFRSHTRLGLYLDEHDYALIQNYFASPAHVFLLVRPHPSDASTAGFFFWEDGHIHRQSTYLEFPFRRAQLVPTAAPVPEEAALAPSRDRVLAAGAATVAPQPPAPRPVAVAAVPAPVALRLRWKFGRRGIGVAAAVFLGFGSLEYAALKLVDHWRGQAALADASPALHVERFGSYLQVNWNRNAPPVMQARRGVLAITDGRSRQELSLDPGQLRTGSVVYFPSGNDVSFQLQLQGRAEVTESVRVVTGAAAPAAAEPPLAVEPPPAIEPPPAREPARRVNTARVEPPAEPVKAPVRRPRAHRWYDDGL